MQYAFTCPLEGCSQTMTVNADSDEEALNRLVDTAKSHLSEKHPDLHKTDDEIRTDIGPKMQKSE